MLTRLGEGQNRGGGEQEKNKKKQKGVYLAGLSGGLSAGATSRVAWKTEEENRKKRRK